MSTITNEKNSILKFIESNRASLRNLRINGGSMISRPCDVTHSKTSSARKLSTPSYQIKTASHQSHSKHQSKDLREVRNDMICRIADLIREIRSMGTRSRSSGKILDATLVFLKRVFEPNDKVKVIVDFLESFLFLPTDLVPRQILDDLRKVHPIPEDKFCFRDLWSCLLQKSLTANASDTSPEKSQFQKQLRKTEMRLQKVESEKRDLAQKLNEQGNRLFYWREIAKEKFAVTRELLDCRFRIIKMDIQNSDLARQCDILKSVEERYCIRDSQLLQKINEACKLTEAQNEKIMNLQTEISRLRALATQSLNDRERGLNSLRTAKDSLNKHLEQLERRMEITVGKSDAENKLAQNLIQLEGYSKTTEKPSRFSITQLKPLISPASKKFPSKISKLNDRIFLSNEPNIPGYFPTKPIDDHPDQLSGGRSTNPQLNDKLLPLQKLLLLQFPIENSGLEFEDSNEKNGSTIYLKEILQRLKSDLDKAELSLLELTTAGDKGF
jgi:hypothetical protein